MQLPGELVARMTVCALITLGDSEDCHAFALFNVLRVIHCAVRLKHPGQVVCGLAVTDARTDSLDLAALSWHGCGSGQSIGLCR